MAEPKAGWHDNSSIEQALGEGFRRLHAAVRSHYSYPAMLASGSMAEIYVKSAIKPLALLSYWLFRGPVPHSGRDVEMSLHNRIDDSGAMHWIRTFFKNASFPETATFPSRMVRSGDHKIIEIARYGVGGESDLSVNAEGNLVYDMRSYVVRVPFRGLIVRFPTWLSPFGGGRTREIGQTENSFRVEFELTHPIFGRTVGYTGRCRFESR